jgi:thioredoxin-related protein
MLIRTQIRFPSVKPDSQGALVEASHSVRHSGMFWFLDGQLRGRLRVPLLLMLALLVGEACAGDTLGMRQVSDLRQEADRIKTDKLVLVLEFASEDCGYCRKLEKLFLLPMQRNKEYNDKILVRSISMSDFDNVIDFDGRSLTTREFAARYGIEVTPTLLFLNAEGIELSERLVGIWSEDFYGGFIDNRIDEASNRL